MISEIKKEARKYPGSYELGVSGRTKLNGAIVTFIAYTNPNNVTNACYVSYRTGGRDYSFVSTGLDIYNINHVKESIAHCMGMENLYGKR